jgi:hypothetical protein
LWAVSENNAVTRPNLFCGGVGGVCQCGVRRRTTACAGAADGDGEVFWRDKIGEPRLLPVVGLTCAEDGDLLECVRGEPWLDRTTDGTYGVIIRAPG